MTAILRFFFILWLIGAVCVAWETIVMCYLPILYHYVLSYDHSIAPDPSWSWFHTQWYFITNPPDIWIDYFVAKDAWGKIGYLLFCLPIVVLVYSALYLVVCFVLLRAFIKCVVELLFG